MGRLLVRLAGALAFLSLIACATESAPPPLESDIEDGPEVDETGDEENTAFWFATAETAVCPEGATFREESGLCERTRKALGPFTSGMVEQCSGAGCEALDWPMSRAVEYRGDETCPFGAKIDEELGVCVEGDFAYGPFDQPMIDECVARGGTDCHGLRWEKHLVAPLPEEIAEDEGEIGTLANPTKCGGLNERLMAYYASREGYSKVSRAGMRTLGTRRNGCATWLSHAIKQVGGSMTVEPNTEGFRDALKRRGWITIRNKADLRPGDVIITKDRKGRPGHPDHVYMFAGWADAAKTVPLAVDNQGFTHARNRGKSPIAYGLRAPDSKNPACNPTDGGADPAQPDRCEGKADGWYCSELRDFSAYQCKSQQISGGWQCADNTVCRKNASGKATLYGSNPGCFGKK